MKIKKCPKPKERPIGIRMNALSGNSGLITESVDFVTATFEVTLRMKKDEDTERLSKKDCISIKELNKVIKNRL